MNKTLKSILALAVCLIMLVATAIFTLAAPGKIKTFTYTATPTTITLSWSKSDNAEGYIVQRYYGGKWKDVKKLTARKHTIKDLTPGSTYKYRIKAYDGKTSTVSKTVTVKTAVAKVTSLKAANNSYASVKLTWGKIAGVTGYQVEKYNASAKKWVKVKTLKASKTSYIAAGLKNGSTQKFRVRAYQTVSKKTYYGAYSAAVSIKVSVPAVTNLKATAKYNSVTLSWTKVPYATAYQVYKYNSSTKKWVAVTQKTTKTTATAKSLLTGTTYSLRVRAYQTVSKKNYYSAWATIKATPVLSKVTSFKSKEVTNSSVSFTWGKVSGAAGYIVYRYDSGEWLNLGKVKTTAYTDEALIPGTQFSYRVKAYRTVNGKDKTSAASSTFKITTLTLNKVDVLTLKNVTENSVTFSWDDVGAAGYYVYSDSTLLKDVGNKTSYTVSGLEAGTSYTFRVKAYYLIGDETMETNMSSALNVTTKGEKPTDPTKPTEPSEPSTEPSSKPTEPSSNPTEPSSNPTEPSSKPTEPSSKPTEPSSKPTEPSSKPTEPSSKPTEPSSKPTETSSKPTEPSTEPSTQPEPQPPEKVTGLKATAQTETSISIKWTPSADADSYIVRYSKSGTGLWTNKESVTPIYTIEGLSENTEYLIKVVAKSGALSADASETITAKTKASTVVIGDKDILIKADGKTLSLNWKSVSSAFSYNLQYYDQIEGWTIVPGGTSLTTTTFSETLSNIGGRLYRVVAVDSTGNTISTSNSVLGTTDGVTVTSDDYKVTISWEKQADAKTYTLYKNVKSLSWIPVEGASETTATSATVYLSPETIHSFTLMINKADGTSRALFTDLNVEMPKMNYNGNSNEDINSQLLYLAQSVNNSKFEQNKVNVKYDSSSQYEIDYLNSTILIIPTLFGEFKGTSQVQKFFDRMNDESTDDKMMATGNDVSTENIDFSYGVGYNQNDKRVKLQSFIEPLSNSENHYQAYIYDSQKPANWKNGFSSVETKPLSGGGYEMTVVMKQENLTSSSNSKYHAGLYESVGAVISEVGSGAEISDAKIGSTTIKAKINKDGLLDSYVISSPYDANLSMSMDLLGSITMHIKGTSNTSYIFTR